MDKAHAIVMGMRDKLAFRIHGLLHRIEGDLDNARYWYGRAAVAFAKSKSAVSEIEEIAAVLRRRPPLRASPPRFEQAHAARHRDVQALDAPAHRDAPRRSQRSRVSRRMPSPSGAQHPRDRRGQLRVVERLFRALVRADDPDVALLQFVQRAGEFVTM